MSDNENSAENFDYFINDYFLNAVVSVEEDLNYPNDLQRSNKNNSNFLVHNDWKNKQQLLQGRMEVFFRLYS